MMKSKVSASISTVFLAVLLAAVIGSCGATDNGTPGTDSDSDSDTDTDSDTDSDTDGDTDSDSDTDGDTDNTIYQVQQGEIAEDETVVLNNVIVTSPYHVEEGGIFVEEPEGGEYSGIYLWGSALVDYDLEPGIEINVTGSYSEFYDISEITVASIEVVGPADVPAPEVVAAADIATTGSKAEAYESVLVKVEELEVTADTNTYGEYVVNDSLMVDDFFFESGTGPSTGGVSPVTGDTFDSITGVMFYSFEEFKLEPRTEADFEGYTGADGDTDTDTDTDAGAEEVTISDIQNGDVADGTTVTITGAVVTTPLNTYGNFFIQEPGGAEYSGIYVYNSPGTADLPAVSQGDEVTITATYQEYNGVSEINLSASTQVTVTGTATVPDPIVVLPADVATTGAQGEAYEGVLIKVENVTVLTVADDYGQFTVTDSLMVDDMFVTETPAVDDAYTSITGPLHYSYLDFKIEPRTAADLAQ